MLKVDNLIATYGSIEALHNISLQVNDDEIVALIGANGAGKTTLLNSISGTVKVKGSIKWDNEELVDKKPADIARKAILQVPEGRHVFPGLTVEENLMVGTVAITGIRIKKGNYHDNIDKVYDLFPRLKERRTQLAWSMSGGEQQMLAIGRAMMGNPKLLMLDEPSMGLAPIVIDELFSKIIDINKQGTPILIVEQNASLALKTASRAYIMEQGNITLSGKASDLANDDRVKEAYLGKSIKKGIE